VPGRRIPLGVEIGDLQLLQLDKRIRFQLQPGLAKGAFRHRLGGHGRPWFQVEERVQFVLQGTFDQVEQKKQSRLRTANSAGA